MTMPLNRSTYQQLIAEDLKWLEAQPRTLERDHIIAIVKASEKHEYDDQITIEKLQAEISLWKKGVH